MATGGVDRGGERATSGDRVRVRVVVAGRVQGVWFRESTRRRAEALGVGGTVRNDADGTVRAVFEGARAAVEQIVAWCHVGPDRALVTSVVVADEDPVGDDTFRVTG